MNWKRKRNIGDIAHLFYRKLLDDLSKLNHVRLIDPDISAISVIEKSCAVISMPYTSTALIARELGKPSIYFDPTGLLQKNDRAAHGIPVISSQVDLAFWLSKQIGQ